MDGKGRTGALVCALTFTLISSLGLSALAEAHGADVARRGQVVLVHGDDFRQGRERAKGVFLKSGGRLYRLPARASVHAGQRVIARGHVRDGRVSLTQVAAFGEGSTSTTSTTATPAAAGTKRVAVIVFNFSDDTSQPFTPASVEQTYFASGATDRSVANYFEEVTWGQTQLTGRAVGWYTIAATSKTCDPGTWADQADAAATKAGVDLSSFDYKTYVYPGVSDCGWGGLAQLPGNRNWINGNPSAGIMIHELGHNFALNHAVSASCTLSGGERVAFSATCSDSEYGDSYDVMGAASMSHHLSGWHRAMLGFTDGVQAVSADGTYTLSPAQAASGQPRALRIPRGDGTWFELEYRQPYGIFDGFSLTSLAVNGVMVRRVASYSIANKPALLDTTPQTPSFADAPLTINQTFADPTTGITVKVLSVDSTGARVDVRVRPGGDFNPPEVSISNPANGGAITLPGTVDVSATDNAGIAKVELYRDGERVATKTSAPYAFAWADGPSGQYAIKAVAYDTAGLSAVSREIVVDATQSDTAAPAMPADLRSVDNRQTSISTTWAPATDNVGVARYRIFRNGVQIDETTDTSYTYTGLTCGGGYTLSVAAVDAAGNVSPRVGTTGWTTACSGDTQPPTVPAGVQAAASGSTAVAISWQPSSDNVGVTGYRVDRDGVTISRTTSTSITDTSVVAGKRYSYVVTAYDGAGNNSGTSSPVRVTTAAGDGQAPTAPTGLQAAATSTSSIALTWQGSTDNTGVEGYEIRRGSTVVAYTSTPGFTDFGLSAGTSYTYTVVAYDAAGNRSAASSEATAKTQDAADAQPPTAPGNLQGKAMKGRKASLTWTAASDNVAVARYRIFRDGTAVGTTSGALSYTDSAARGPHTYYVVAVDAAGNEGPSSNAVSLSLK